MRPCSSPLRMGTWAPEAHSIPAQIFIQDLTPQVGNRSPRTVQGLEEGVEKM